MTKTETATRPRGDSVDRLIDDVLREPSRAEDVKRALRRRMAAEGADDTLIATLAAQLRDTARAIAGDTPDAPADAS